MGLIIPTPDTKEKELAFLPSEIELSELIYVRDGGGYLKFNDYHKVGDPDSPPEIEISSYRDDTPFKRMALIHDDNDPRFFTFKIGRSEVPERFRVYFRCLGVERITQKVETLFYGTIDVI